MAYCELRHIAIKATPDRSADGVKFEMYENGSQIADETIKCTKTSAMKKVDSHLVVFTLDDDSGLDLRFLKDPDEVMWVAGGTQTSAPSCPKKSSKEDDFGIFMVTDDALIVTNKNSSKRMHKFVLNFLGQKANGATGLIQYDPIWGNGNGGS